MSAKSQVEQPTNRPSGRSAPPPGCFAGWSMADVMVWCLLDAMARHNDDTRAVARELSVSRKTVYNWLNGERREVRMPWSDPTLEQIAVRAAECRGRAN